jgi:hypothetical protein
MDNRRHYDNGAKHIEFKNATFYGEQKFGFDRFIYAETARCEDSLLI